MADRLVAEGTTPLDYMLGVMRGAIEYDEPRFEAAKASAPYCHAKLVASKVEGEIKVCLGDLIAASYRDEREAEEVPAHH